MSMALDWYFLRVQVGREDRIRESMVKRLKQEGIEVKVPQIVVPTETIADHRQGKKRIQRRKLYPGYLMVQMDLDDSVWFVLRETPGFGDFLGTRGEPSPLTEVQVTSILSRMSDSEERPQVAISLRKGDMVKIKSGAFDGFDGTVDEVNPDKGTIKVIVTIFGRPTPVELEYWEVESL